MSLSQRRPAPLWQIEPPTDPESRSLRHYVCEPPLIRRQQRTREAEGDWSQASDEETDEPLVADHRNFYKVEKWSKDEQRIERMLWAGNSLDKAQTISNAEIKRRPRIRLTIRQRTRVLQRWP